QHRPRPVDAVLALHREVPVHEHRQQPVRGRPGHPQPLGDLRHGRAALHLQDGRRPQRVIHAGDGIGRRRLERFVHSGGPFRRFPAPAVPAAGPPRHPRTRSAVQNSGVLHRDTRQPVGMTHSSLAQETVTGSPVRLEAVAAEGQPEVTPALEELYRGFEKELLVPLWTEIGDLMPAHPRSRAVPHLWRWDRLRELAAQAGDLVPVGRGGERRAIALANPSPGGPPFAAPTLWAAIQSLMPGEEAPEHRHTQHAFRFVVEGEGVWTVVGRDPVAMRRGDFLPQAGWNMHAHHNATSEPMAWIDGLDIPFQYTSESQFFEFGRDEISDAERITPDRSRSERLWGHPGLRPVGAAPAGPGSPLLAYRW